MLHTETGVFGDVLVSHNWIAMWEALAIEGTSLKWERSAVDSIFASFNQESRKSSGGHVGFRYRVYKGSSWFQRNKEWVERECEVKSCQGSYLRIVVSCKSAWELL